MGRSCSCQVCMGIRGEQSWGMHVKWGDGGDLTRSDVTKFYSLLLTLVINQCIVTKMLVE